MSVTISSAVRVDSRTWRLAWSSDLEDPVFYVWRDGRLVASTPDTSMLFTAAVGESLLVEVLDDSTASPLAAWPSRARLEWRGAAGAERYRVEEYVSGEWTARDYVRDRGEGWFSWESRVLEDSASHQFRVTPVGANGNDGAPRTFTLLMVRVPDVPDVDFAYDSDSRKVTVSAA